MFGLCSLVIIARLRCILEETATHGLGVTHLDIERMRSLYADGRHREAFQLYCQMVLVGETDAEQCLIGGLAAEKLGNLWAAKDALESCLEREPGAAILGKARFVLGLVMRKLGKEYEASQLLTTFLDGLSEYPELRPVAYGQALYNRGIAYQYLCRLEDSLYDFSAACTEFRSEGLSRLLCMALHNLAWVGALFYDSIQASRALEEARPLCDTPNLKWHQRLGEAFLVAIERDPFDKTSERVYQRRALELCEVIHNHQGDDLPSLIRSQAYWLAGKISLDLGEIDDAYRLGQEAIHSAFEAPAGSRCLYDAADLLRQVRSLRPHVNQAGPE